jgi:hypothetical protein
VSHAIQSTPEGVETTEFPELANRFNVRGVPQTVINSGAGSVVGAVPEQNLLAKITHARCRIKHHWTRISRIYPYLLCL